MRKLASLELGRLLPDSFWAQPSSLAAGAIMGLACGITAIILGGSKLIAINACALMLAGVVRVYLEWWMRRDHGQGMHRLLAVAFGASSIVYALLAGLLAAITLLRGAQPALATLMIAHALVYGISLAARTAGKPRLAAAQLLLSTSPIAVAAVIVGGASNYVLAGALGVAIVAVFSIIRRIFAILQDHARSIKENAVAATSMRQLAFTDPATQLLNRTGFHEELAPIVSHLPAKARLALFWIDLDRFKEINDNWGHPVGDLVLVEIADRLKRMAPAGGLVARFGGDEFILASPVAGLAEAESISRAVTEELSRPVRANGRRILAGGSVGVAIMPDHGNNVESLLECADLALYQAKHSGSSNVRFFDESMSRERARKKEIETELRLAIERDELSIFFHPLVDLRTGKVRSFEALVRWFHPQRGELAPAEFIPIAEETGVIITLGNWITGQAARACASWPEEITVSVNLSTVQIRAPGAALGILNGLRDARLAPSRLELEVTESLFLDESSDTAAFMADLAAEGVKFVLDDFGTGNSSLGYFNRYPISRIKVDRSMVAGPSGDRMGDAILRAVAELGATLGIDIVAEGLETLEQVQAVRSAGCTMGQGYYFSRPVPDYLAAFLVAEQTEQELAARRAG